MNSDFSDVPFLDEAADGALEEELPKLIVILDTDPGIRWAMEKGLASSGYRVRSVATIGEALTAVRAESVAAVVLEILPEAGLTPDYAAHADGHAGAAQGGLCIGRRRAANGDRVHAFGGGRLLAQTVQSVGSAIRAIPCIESG